MLFKNISSDLKILKSEHGMNPVMAILANRGFHALFIYRLCHFLNSIKMPLIPLILTRIVQIIYSIDIDYHAKLDGGIVIFHGVGIVIGYNTKIGGGVTIYQG